MEVHHHAHTARQKWTHYFWEFLMLFLAVFCGFLAEYQLEHKIEKDREKQFIKSMISDLQDDVRILDELTGAEIRAVHLLDTLIYLLSHPDRARVEGDQLYFAARLGPRSTPFANNSRTFDQLKNSGSFRLIRKADASNMIMGYYTQFSLVRLLEDNYNHEFDNYKKTGARLLDAAILRRQENSDGTIYISNDNPPLLTYEPLLLNEFGFHAIQMNGSRRGKIQLLKQLRDDASKLIAYLKNRYHLN
jgi:hypothetical protein